MDRMTTAFIGLGSNLGDGRKILRAAWKQLGRMEGVTLGSLSQPYLTAPVDMESSNWFTNAVGSLQTTLQPGELLQGLFAVERAFGRKRDAATTGYQDRCVDLDLLCFGTTVLDTPELVLPHPGMAKRLFVLVPFVDIAPDYRDLPNGPTIGQRCARLLAQVEAGKYPRQELKERKWED